MEMEKTPGLGLGHYRGLLAVIAAGALGISLLCSVSSMAMQDLNVATAMALQPADVVDSFISNMNTAGAMTMQAFAEFVATPTVTASTVPTSTPTPTLSVTPSKPSIFQFPTSFGPTSTRRPRIRPSSTFTRAPTRTPTRTPVPTRTLTKTPLPSRTPTVPSPTPVPTQTDTPVPPPSDTPLPPPSDTPEPPPSPTDVPPPTETQSVSTQPAAAATPTPTQ
ncbi:MAG TPA: hypothetical protein VI524_14160 [Anaerolineales bacterium]|nr:hypothetical protein [Anaerolineales bacterium]